MKIGIELKSNAYTPEAFAYFSFLNNLGHKVEITRKEDFSIGNDVNILFMGLQLFHEKSLKKETLIVHEYHSLSTGILPRVKNKIKNYLNIQPSGRIFLNDFVRSELGFSEDISCIYREMGVDDSFYNAELRTIEFDLIYSGSIEGRPGLLEEILRLGKIGLSILVVGRVTEQIKNNFLDIPSVVFTGQVSRQELSKLYSIARAGLNYTPNFYPFNVQTSTKTLEYYAAGLGVVSNSYMWINQFSIENDIQYLNIDSITSKSSFDEYRFLKYDMNKYRWSNILKECNFEKFLLNLR